jgi:hypothetical protein
MAIKPIPSIKISAKYSSVHRDEITDNKLGGQFDYSF